MKLKFKQQDFQTRAVDSVVNCFSGQPNLAGLKYRVYPGEIETQTTQEMFEQGFKNADLALTNGQILQNIRAVQNEQNLVVSASLVKTDISSINLDVEMETGTGKTYCYIKTAFEMNKRYGWSKFIVVVPSIAIREGVYKSLKMTAEHFLEAYGKKAKFFIYNSKQLHELESFSYDAGINIMVINIQAFNARGKDNRRIYQELDDFQSRKPIDVIKANRPILVLDEPQKMEGKKTLESLKNFNPLMILRYSATHKTNHNKVHRLDAIDAYNQKLVKKISVRGITIKGHSGSHGYLYLQSIEISTSAPVARMEIEIRQKTGIKRVTRKIKKGDDLYILSGGLDQYQGFVVSEIDARVDRLSFTNGVEVYLGEAVGDVSESSLRRIQIREAVHVHFEKEKELFHQGIKVLSLFFIDRVSNYRQYSEAGEEENGEYARIFEEEYTARLEEIKAEASDDYKNYLGGIKASKTHNGYFSIDKKTKRLIDPETKKTSSESDDTSAYDLILKDKERLLSFEEPTRFIFSHSALREGWDNPNVFVICALKHSDNTISRRQEVGRGLRISVNQHGERQDEPTTVHDTNVLTVVANESYGDFVDGLQRDIRDSLSGRPQKADENYFKGKVIKTAAGDIRIDDGKAQKIYAYLVINNYIDKNKHISNKYHDAVKNNKMAELPEELKPYKEQILELIEGVYTDKQLPKIDDDRKKKQNPLNDNYHKREFQELWDRINKKAICKVKVGFDSDELIEKSVAALEKLKISPIRYTIIKGEQREKTSFEDIRGASGFKQTRSEHKIETKSAHSQVKYDLIGKLTEGTGLTRKTVGSILLGLKEETFAQFQINPEDFIAKVITVINEEKAPMVIEHLTYDTIDKVYSQEIFTDAQSNQIFSKTTEKLKKHIYNYLATDSDIERDFSSSLEIASEVVVYAKLPRGFSIPTPIGNYNPDWAISFQEGTVKHIYFIAETKGSMKTMQLRGSEKEKIECAKKFFTTLNEKISLNKVKYDEVTNFEALMDLVR